MTNGTNDYKSLQSKPYAKENTARAFLDNHELKVKR